MEQEKFKRRGEKELEGNEKVGGGDVVCYNFYKTSSQQKQAWRQIIDIILHPGLVIS